ncbi:MAG TPA: DUF2252 domain-containing protein [Plasticicumulans sp.]|nr:DUF2252 domain-containing protein [Plasticicumulans sp.]HNF67509.1 DUF2252 domain-containing protein [Plasticicumulans sp.]
MSDAVDPELRQQRGKALRKRASRKQHDHIGGHDRDPVALLEASSRTRLPRLLPLRYGRMLASPFAFFRGSAIVQAHDLAGTPYSGLIVPLCGDCHLMNFGGFATPERNLIFDVNDFDETHPGPWEWDVKRLAASFHIAARHQGYAEHDCADIVAAALDSYREHTKTYARCSELELWYDRISFERLIQEAEDPDMRAQLAQTVEKASGRTHEHLLPKLGSRTGDHWTMHDAPPGLFHIHGPASLFEPDDDWRRPGDWQRLIQPMYAAYLDTVSSSHRALLGRFRAQDLAFKVVGVGSVGTRCLVLLLTDGHDSPLFLQFKEALPSVLADYVPAGRCPYRHQGRRVVAGKRLMQASSDIFLGWTTAFDGRQFYVRQLRDMKVSPEIETYDEAQLHYYAASCGRVLARGHARAGGLAPEIAGYLGNGDAYTAAVLDYARDYADRVEQDFEKFRSACRSGRLQAQTEADLAAEFRV